MTPQEIAQRLITVAGSPKLTETLLSLQQELTIEVVNALMTETLGVYKQDAAKALLIATVMEKVSYHMNVAQGEAQALAISMKAAALNEFGRYDEALDLYEEAERFFERQQSWRRVIALRINQVAVLRNLGKYTDAIQLAQDAQKMLEKSKEPLDVYQATLEINVAWAYKQVGNLEAALAAYQHALAINLEMEHAIKAASVQQDMGILLEEMGRFDEAESLFETAKNTFFSMEQWQEVARLELNLGILAFRRAQHQKALGHLEISRTGFAELQNKSEVAFVDLYRSHVYLELNLLDEAIELAVFAEKLFRQLKQQWPRALVFINLARAYHRQGHLSLASQFYTKVRRLLNQLSAKPMLRQVDSERAALALDEGRIDTARRIGQRVLKQLDQKKEPLLLVRIWHLLAQCALLQVNPNLDQAEKYANALLSLIEQVGLVDFRADAFYLQGQIAEKRGAVLLAKVHYEESLTAVTILRQSLSIDELQINYMVNKLPIYEAGIRLLHDHFRGTAVNELIYALNQVYTAPLISNIAIPDPDGNDELATKLLRLRQMWHWHHSHLTVAKQIEEESGNADTNDETLMQLNRVEADLAEVLRRYQIRQTIAVNSSRRNSSPDNFLVELQTRIHPKEALVVYYIVKERCQAAVITSRQVQLVSDLTDVSFIKQFLRAWRFHISHQLQQISQPEKAVQIAQQYLQQFSKRLIDPLRPFLSKKTGLTLVIPPTWHQLPFAAAFDGQRYLAQDFHLAYLTSPEIVLNRDASQTSNISQQALLIAHSDDKRLLHTLAEVDAVAASLPETWGSTTIKEKAATVQSVTANFANHALIHVAAHAQLRPDNPLFSWIRLADDFLTVADVQQINMINHPFIVLSACDSGRGTPRGGGLLGMSRALLASGASGLIVSQWAVDDGATAELMIAFYEALLSDAIEISPHAARVALQQAQQKIIVNQPHPFYWAGLICVEG